MILSNAVYFVNLYVFCRFALALSKTRWLTRRLHVGLRFGLWNTLKLFEVSHYFISLHAYREFHIEKWLEMDLAVCFKLD